MFTVLTTVCHCFARSDDRLLVGLVELTESHFYYQMLLVLVLLRLYCKSFNVLFVVASSLSPKAFAKLRLIFELTKCFGNFNFSLTLRRELFSFAPGLCRFASAKL